MFKLPVEAVMLAEKTTRVTHETRFEFNPKGRAVWLQKALFWVLRKLKCFAVDARTSYTKVPLGGDFLDQLFRAKKGMWVLGREPECLLIGSADFDKLRGTTLSEAAPYELSFVAEYYQGPRVMGLRVHIIPWMEGWVVLPKGWDER